MRTIYVLIKTDGQREWYIQSKILVSQKKRMKSCHLIQYGQGIRVTEISQTEKDKYHMISYLCTLKYKINKQTKQKETHRYREKLDGHQMEGWLREQVKKIKRIKKYKLPVTKIVMRI